MGTFDGRRAGKERRLDGWWDVADGLGGVAVMAAGLVTPFLRARRAHWGIEEEAARRRYPGDDLVARPRWSWTHGVVIEVSADEVWPWIAQIGADRAGFYSYQWLENLAGCNLRNADVLHSEWQVEPGGRLLLHPKVPALPVVAVEPGRYFVAHARPDQNVEADRLASWAEASWLFFVEPLGAHRSRVISRYRCATSDDLAARLAFGPTFVEPVGFAMDRRMLLGIKERCERAASTHGKPAAPARSAQGARGRTKTPSPLHRDHA